MMDGIRPRTPRTQPQRAPARRDSRRIIMVAGIATTLAAIVAIYIAINPFRAITGGDPETGSLTKALQEGYATAAKQIAGVSSIISSIVNPPVDPEILDLESRLFKELPGENRHTNAQP